MSLRGCSGIPGFETLVFRVPRYAKPPGRNGFHREWAGFRCGDRLPFRKMRASGENPVDFGSTMPYTSLRIGIAAAIVIGAPFIGLIGPLRSVRGPTAGAVERLCNLQTAAIEMADPDRLPAQVPAGTWGGEHVRLEATEHGGQLEFDCARGAIDEPLTLDDGGRFSVKGTYLREHPGPIRPGREAGARPATYSGEVHGTRMTLRVVLTGSSESESDASIAPFALTLGTTGKIRKCR